MYEVAWQTRPAARKRRSEGGREGLPPRVDGRGELDIPPWRGERTSSDPVASPGPGPSPCPGAMASSSSLGPSDCSRFTTVRDPFLPPPPPREDP